MSRDVTGDMSRDVAGDMSRDVAGDMSLKIFLFACRLLFYGFAMPIHHHLRANKASSSG